MPANHSQESDPDQLTSTPAETSPAVTSPAVTSPAVTGDQLLPPVEPPNARFIMQLFIIPAIIVLCVVMVWTLFGWLASRSEENVESIVKSLRSSSHARWQAANELARMLQLEQRYPELKENRQLAGKLAQLLGEHLEAGNVDEDSIDMRSFLCRALGEFRVDEGMGVLLKVVGEDQQPDVRREAIKALAVLGNTFLGEHSPDGPFDVDGLVRTLIQLSTDQDELIRSETAYAMGACIHGKDASKRNSAVPDEESQDKGLFTLLVESLTHLLDDTHVDTRYNAALGLTRVGNLKAIGTIAEMLDLKKLSTSMAGERDPQQQAYKRNLMLRNAIEAATKLFELNPQYDLSVLEEALETFLVAAPAVTLPAPIPAILRYNTAVALAQVGNLTALETIAEILDLKKLSEGLAAERTLQRYVDKRNFMLRKAIEAAAKLHQLNPQHDLSVLQDALKTFLADAPVATLSAPIPQDLCDQAERLLQALQP